jgi:F-box protein 18 (helicase)
MELNLTEEQLAVINFPLKTGEVLVVEAGAGTGKTTCFIEFAKTKPKDRILYLCFNNKSAKEAQSLYLKSGVNNTKASTVHGLAHHTKSLYTKAGKFQNKIYPKDLLRQPSLKNLDITRICVVLKTIKNFCESSDQTITTAHLPNMEGLNDTINKCLWANHTTKLKNSETTNSLVEGPEEVTEEGKKTVESYIVELSNEVWGMMVNKTNPMPISYDHYLKIYELSQPTLPFDYILLDEAQDSNPVTLSILESQKHRLKTIVIGDKNQAIYGWRGAKDAMGRYDCVGALSLTNSFRFGKNIAKLANTVLKKYQENPREIKGVNQPDNVNVLNKRVTPQTKYSETKDANHPTINKTFIARTNATLFDKAISLANNGLKYHFHGTTKENNWDPSALYRLNDLKDVYHLWSKNPKRVINPYISIYATYENLRKAAFGEQKVTNKHGNIGNIVQKPDLGKNQGDPEIAYLCKLVEKYKHAIPTITKTLKDYSVGPANEISRDTNEQSPCITTNATTTALTTLTTAHRAKGLEWDNVEIAQDFLKNLQPGIKGDIIEEHNLLYVAITRAKKMLFIDNSLVERLAPKKVLEPAVELESIG